MNIAKQQLLISIDLQKINHYLKIKQPTQQAVQNGRTGRETKSTNSHLTNKQ